MAILAGGQGRRLGGADKGLQLVDGKPLIAHVCAALAAMHASRDEPDRRVVLILANRNHGTYSTHATTMRDDVDCGEGPLAGIATALSTATTPWLLTVPVDCPCPPAELWQRLRAGIADADAAVAHDGRNRQPLFALYRAGLARSAIEAAQAGMGPREWQHRIATADVDFRDRCRNFSNLNTAEDLLAWRKPSDD